MAREALSRKNMHAGILDSLRIQLDQEPTSIKNLKRNLTLLEAKISEAKTMRISLKARIAAIKPNEHQQSIAGQLDASSAMSAFERMEKKVLQMETRSQAASELGEVDLENQFAMLDAGSDVDEELEAMKAQLLGSSLQLQSQFLGSEPSNTLLDCAAVDDELNDLKRMLDQL